LSGGSVSRCDIQRLPGEAGSVYVPILGGSSPCRTGGRLISTLSSRGLLTLTRCRTVSFSCLATTANEAGRLIEFEQQQLETVACSSTPAAYRNRCRYAGAKSSAQMVSQTLQTRLGRRVNTGGDLARAVCATIPEIIWTRDFARRYPFPYRRVEKRPITRANLLHQQTAPGVLCATPTQLTLQARSVRSETSICSVRNVWS